MNNLYVMIGLPGSGKSTIAKEIKNAQVVSTDEIRGELYGDAGEQKNPGLVFRIAFDRINEYLSKGDVVFDATNLSRKDRKKLFKMIEEPARKIAVFVSSDVENCKARNVLRERQVPDDVIDRMANKLTPPELDEGFDEINFIDMDEVFPVKNTYIENRKKDMERQDDSYEI